MLLTIVSFILVMGVIVFVHELGHFLVAKRNKIVVEEFGFGYPPRLVKLFERDGTVYSINAIPFGGFCRMRGEDDPTAPGSFAAASRTARALTLLAGPGMNFLLAIALFAVVAIQQGVPDPSKTGVVILSIQPGSPAERAGLRVGDRLTVADGVPLATGDALRKLTAENPGRQITYTVVRTDKRTKIEQTLQIAAASQALGADGRAILGIGPGQPTRPAQVWEAAWAGIRGTGEIIYLTFSVPANLIREGKPISDAGFMGPVGIAATTGEVVQSALEVKSSQPVIWFMALLSAALGLTNLLPLPALDGGRLLFILVEALRGGKRIQPAQEGMVHLIGFGLLLLLVGMLTIKEVTALINHSFPSLGIR